MSVKGEKHQWVWVVVQDPDREQRLLGQLDEENDTTFIPTFLDKEAAEECFLKIVRQKGHKYEIQAIIYEDLLDLGAENGFTVFILDGEGKLLKKGDQTYGSDQPGNDPDSQ